MTGREQGHEREELSGGSYIAAGKLFLHQPDLKKCSVVDPLAALGSLVAYSRYCASMLATYEMLTCL